MEQCNYETFPSIAVFLPSWEIRHPLLVFDDGYRQLRLVCRAFKDLLGPNSPRFIMRGRSTVIRTTCRSLRMCGYWPNFTPYLEGPARYRQLVCLEVACISIPPKGLGHSFDILCKHSSDLQRVRTLNLRLTQFSGTRRELPFWTRLSRSFPRLLFLTVKLNDGAVSLLQGDDETAVFEQMEILCLSTRVTYPRIHHPSLRHVSLDVCSQSNLDLLTQSSLLESILILSFSYQVERIDMRPLSHLRLLGIPELGVESIVPLDRAHSLDNLRLYPGRWTVLPDAGKQLAQCSSRIPSLLKITTDLSRVDSATLTLYYERFENCDLRSHEWSMKPRQPGNLNIVLDREVVTTPTWSLSRRKGTKIVTPGKQEGRMQEMWKDVRGRLSALTTSR